MLEYRGFLCVVAAATTKGGGSSGPSLLACNAALIRCSTVFFWGAEVSSNGSEYSPGSIFTLETIPGSMFTAGGGGGSIFTVWNEGLL